MLPQRFAQQTLRRRESIPPHYDHPTLEGLPQLTLSSRSSAARIPIRGTCGRGPRPTQCRYRAASVRQSSHPSHPSHLTEQPSSYAAAQAMTEAQASSQILNAQRRNRPVAPHLTIYKPQVTWIMSSLNRMTGVAMSGSLYLFGTAYLVAPALGWHLETAVMAAAFASWPLFVKIGIKALVALPFTFHSFNGIRHLAWDTASMITNERVIQTGWTVIGLSVVSALALAFM